MASLYRADQVGSLLQPPELLQARDDYKEKRLTLDELRRIEDRAILEALAMQRQAGVNGFTDGEYRGLIEAVEGFVPGEVQLENPQACRLLGAVTTIAFGAPSRDSGPSSPRPRSRRE